MKTKYPCSVVFKKQNIKRDLSHLFVYYPTKNSTWASYMAVKDPSSGTVSSCLPGRSLAEAGNRNKAQTPNWTSSVKHGCPKWHIKLLWIPAPLLFYSVLYWSNTILSSMSNSLNLSCYCLSDLPQQAMWSDWSVSCRCYGYSSTCSLKPGRFLNSEGCNGWWVKIRDLVSLRQVGGGPSEVLRALGLCY